MPVNWVVLVAKILRKTSNKSPEFSSSDSRMKIVSVYNIQLNKVTHFNKCLTSQDHNLLADIALKSI